MGNSARNVMSQQRQQMIDSHMHSDLSGRPVTDITMGHVRQIKDKKSQERQFGANKTGLNNTCGFMQYGLGNFINCLSFTTLPRYHLYSIYKTYDA